MHEASQPAGDNVEQGEQLPLAWRHARRVAEHIREKSRESGLVVTWLNHWSTQKADWVSVARADFVGIDGTFLQILLARGGMNVGRSSADLVIPQFLDLVGDDARIALIGGEQGIAESAAARLEGVVYTANGFDGLRALRQDLDPLVNSAPNIVVLGLGAGLQDQVASEVAEVLPDAVIFTAGGWLDQLTAREQYFPPIVHTLRLGWLWRILHEPRRLIGRYTVDAVTSARQAEVIRHNLHRATHQSADLGFMGRSSRAATGDESADNLRVLQLVTQLEPAGAQSMARWLEQQLEQNYAVRTAFLYQKSPSDLFQSPDLLVKDRPSGPASMARFGAALLKLRRTNPDVVLAHTHFSIALATLLWGKSGRVQVVPVHHWPIDRYPSIVRRIIDRARRRSFYADEVFVSPAVADLDPANVIPNPVPEPGPYEDAGAVPTDILVVARHAEEKSIDTAIRAMEGTTRHLTLVGGGPLTDVLKEQVKASGLEDNVTFAGRLSNPQVRQLMRSSRTFLLPSLWEAMPVALLEAVAEDARIIVSDIDAHQFLLAQDAAIPFVPGDAASLREALELAITEESAERLAMGRVRVQENYSATQIATLWRDTVQAAAKRVR